jgi:response regulator RpfG family c-di-GMP phosphodiesterase
LFNIEPDSVLQIELGQIRKLQNYPAADNKRGEKRIMNRPEFMQAVEKIKTSKSPDRCNVLVVDDEPNILRVVSEMLEDEPYNLIPAYSVAEARSILPRQNINIILTDLLLGDGTGEEILEEARRIHPDCQVILMTGRPTIQNAIRMLKKGVYDYLAKPFGMETLTSTLRRAEEKIKLEKENYRLREMMSLHQISDAMGKTTELDDLLELILKSTIGEFEAEIASIYFLSDKSGDIELKASIGDEDSALRQLVDDNCMEIMNATITTGNPIIFSDPDSGFSSDDIAFKSCICHPLMAGGRTIGAILVVRVKNSHPFSNGQLTGLGILASKAAIAIEKSNLYEDLKETYFATVESLANAIEARDTYTRGHTERVYKLSQILAAELGWSEDELGDLRIGGILHDIGKIGVPDSILKKSGPLTDEEFEIMKKHPEAGVHMVEGIPFLKTALPYILYHHERHDGNGYPHGLKGHNIPKPGRLLAVVDTIDAVTSNRSYREGRSLKEAIEEIKKNSGTQFDPEVVAACVDAYEQGKLDLLFNNR